MLCLDTNFLVDYLEREDYTLAFLESIPRDDTPPRIPTIALYELYTGAIRSDAAGDTIQTVVDAIDWGEPLCFDAPAAREAARIRAALLDQGEPIPIPDTLIAGTARRAGARVVTTDPHFATVPNLEVVDPRSY